MAGEIGTIQEVLPHAQDIARDAGGRAVVEMVYVGDDLQATGVRVVVGSKTTPLEHFPVQG